MCQFVLKAEAQDVLTTTVMNDEAAELTDDALWSSGAFYFRASLGFASNLQTVYFIKIPLYLPH